MKEISVLKAKRFGVYSCHEAHTLKDAATLMNERNISSLVVVDDDGALRGIITRSAGESLPKGKVSWPTGVF